MRLNEVCGLRLEDVQDDCFEVTSGKTEAAVRRVPVHPVIQALVDYQLRTSTDGYLVPGLKPGGYDRKRGWSVSKRFGRRMRQLGVPKGVVFHSLRKNFTTALEQARVPRNEIELLLGWQRAGLLSGWGSPPSGERLQPAADQRHQHLLWRETPMPA